MAWKVMSKVPFESLPASRLFGEDLVRLGADAHPLAGLEVDLSHLAVVAPLAQQALETAHLGDGALDRGSGRCLVGAGARVDDEVERGPHGRLLHFHLGRGEGEAVTGASARALEDPLGLGRAASACSACAGALEAGRERCDRMPTKPGTPR